MKLFPKSMWREEARYVRKRAFARMLDKVRVLDMQQEPTYKPSKDWRNWYRRCRLKDARLKGEKTRQARSQLIVEAPWQDPSWWHSAAAMPFQV